MYHFYLFIPWPFFDSKQQSGGWGATCTKIPSWNQSRAFALFSYFIDYDYLFIFDYFPILHSGGELTQSHLCLILQLERAMEICIFMLPEPVL